MVRMIVGGVYQGPLNVPYYDGKSGTLDWDKQSIEPGLGWFVEERVPIKYRVFIDNFWLNDLKNYFLVNLEYLKSREKVYSYNLFRNRGFIFGDKRIKGRIVAKGYTKGSSREELVKLNLRLKNLTVDKIVKVMICEGWDCRWTIGTVKNVRFEERRENINWMGWTVEIEYIDTLKEDKMRWSGYSGDIDLNLFVDTQEDTDVIMYIKVPTNGEYEIEVNGEKVKVELEGDEIYKYDSSEYGIFKAVGSDWMLIDFEGIVNDFKPGYNKIKIDGSVNSLLVGYYSAF